jgi:hypothetical protein
MRYKIKRFRSDNGRGGYDYKTFRYVLAARGTTYESCPLYAHNQNGVAESTIRTITENAQAMTIHSEAPIQFWRAAVITAVYLHQRSPNKGLKKIDRDGHKAAYKTPYKMLDGFCNPTDNADRNEISYHTSIYNLCQFECYASRLIPEVQHCQGKLGPCSKPCMMIGYTHHSKMLWRIWDPEFLKVNTQSEVVFDKQRNAHMSCQHESNEIDIFGLPEDKE